MTTPDKVSLMDPLVRFERAAEGRIGRIVDHQNVVSNQLEFAKLSVGLGVLHGTDL